MVSDGKLKIYRTQVCEGSSPSSGNSVTLNVIKSYVKNCPSKDFYFCRYSDASVKGSSVFVSNSELFVVSVIINFPFLKRTLN